MITTKGIDEGSSSLSQIDLRCTSFILGAAHPRQFPADVGWEVAIAGRSNAGKSSVINVITGLKSLARVSKTPGRTREINFFKVDSQRRLVDLPGYGYARVPVKIRQSWRELIEQYFEQRQCLCGVIVIMDCRHPLTDFDKQMLQWCGHAHLPVHLLLNKADKLSHGGASAVLHQVQRRLIHEYQSSSKITIQLFSAFKRIGLGEVQNLLTKWMEMAKKGPGL